MKSKNVTLRLRKNMASEMFELVSVGPYTVRLRCSDGVIIQIPRKRVEGQLPRSTLTPKMRYSNIPTPMGGQPKIKKKRRRK